MGYLKIDQKKCKKDGFCVRECPRNIIQFRKDDGYPDLIQGGEKMCSLCGHCVIVCPYKALDHEKIPLSACPPIRKDLVINEEQAAQFLRSRRSIRCFKDKPVEKEKIERLINIARYAPTASNRQLVEWLVIKDKAIIRQIASLTIDGFRRQLEENPEMVKFMPTLPRMVRLWDKGLDLILRNAPVLVVASAPGETANGMVDLTIALSYLELFAPTLGLGACWAGLVQSVLLSSRKLKKLVGIPANHPYHYPMMVGYPAHKYYRLPERKPPSITFSSCHPI